MRKREERKGRRQLKLLKEKESRERGRKRCKVGRREGIKVRTIKFQAT